MSLDELVQRNPASPVDPKSRYASAGLIEATLATGKVVYLRRRFVPAPDEYETRWTAQPQPGERPDNLAARLLGDPLAFWILADANAVLHPWELVEQRQVDVPGPRFPGTAPPLLLERSE